MNRGYVQVALQIKNDRSETNKYGGGSGSCVAEWLRDWIPNSKVAGSNPPISHQYWGDICTVFVLITQDAILTMNGSIC